jgi:hypothetical protein
MKESDIKAKLRVVLLADSVVVAESDAIELWTKVLQQMRSHEELERHATEREVPE